MKTEAQRIAIAEACGWTRRKTTLPDNVQNWNDPHGNFSNESQIPDYLNDLNAMHEAEKVLTEEQQFEFSDWLRKIAPGMSGPVFWRQVHATAAQRAEAFLRALGKYK